LLLRRDFIVSHAGFISQMLTKKGGNPCFSVCEGRYLSTREASEGGYDLDGRAVRFNDADLFVGEIVPSRTVLAPIIQEISTKASENSEV